MPQGSQYKRWRLAGPKSPLSKKCGIVFRWSPSPAHADLMFMDLPMTQTSPAEFQHDRRHTQTYSTLRLSGAGHSRSSNLRTFDDTKKWRYGCDGIRSCRAVTNVSGAVPRVVETVRDKQVSTEKNTQSPTRPYARTPGQPYGYPHERQNSWYPCTVLGPTGGI